MGKDKDKNFLKPKFQLHRDYKTSIDVYAWTILFYITKGFFNGGGLVIEQEADNEYTGENPISPFCENGIRAVIMRSDVLHIPVGISALSEMCERGVIVFQLPQP